MVRQPVGDRVAAIGQPFGIVAEEDEIVHVAQVTAAPQLAFNEVIEAVEVESAAPLAEERAQR